MTAKTKAPKLQVQRIPHPGADYLKLSGAIDGSFSLEQLGPITRPTALDLRNVESITSQGVERWCDIVRMVPQTTPMFLLNITPAFAAQIEFVPNFLGHAELLSASAVAKCSGCEREAPSIYDLMLINAGSQLLDRCSKCGAVMVALDVDLLLLANRRARNIPDDVAQLLAKLGVYQRSAQTKQPFEVQKLIEGSANLLRLSGQFDEKFRWLRMIDGLEGTLLLDSAQLEIPPGAPMRKFVELLQQLVKACSPVVLVDVPSTALEAMTPIVQLLSALTIHSVVVPCYCSSCDEIRQISIEGPSLLVPEPKGTCPRCGREAPLVAGMVALDGVRALLRGTPSDLMPLIGRIEELFSAAEVEAKLTTPGAVEAATEAPERIGPYRIVRTIAAGGMATVFLAVRDDFSKPMALKLLRREVLSQARVSLTMFLREARLSARLNHPNIVQVFDVNESEGNLYIVMEYLEGQALWRILGHYGRPFPVPIALRIVGQVLRALAHAHAAKDADGHPLEIVHRDVSPSNIILGVDGNVKLIDFGIALAGSKPDVMAGNPAWMSPEQFSGTALDGRSDLFSVATVLHELLIGRQLFTGANVSEIGLKIISGPMPQPPPGVSAALASVLMRAQQRNPAQRYQSATEFADALREIATQYGGEASEHDVRTFVSDVMSRPRAISNTHDIALCETPFSDPAQPGPHANVKPAPIHTSAPINTPPAVSLPNGAEVEDGRYPLPHVSAEHPVVKPEMLARAEFDAPPSNAAALLPLVDPPPNRTPTVLLALFIVVALAAIAALSIWMI